MRYPEDHFTKVFLEYAKIVKEKKPK